MDAQATSSESFTVSRLMRELVPEWEPERWFEWPPDLFALTSHLLRTTGIYRTAASLRPGERSLDPLRWEQESRPVIQEWYNWIGGFRDALPDRIAALKDTLTSELRLNCYGEDLPPELCRAILELHAYADDACANFGFFSGSPAPMYFLANLHLAATGSLSRIPKRHGVVLPKHRTPQTGLSPRSLSLHLTYHQSEVNVHWRTIPWVNRHRNENTLNVVVVPWPYQIRSSDFGRAAAAAADAEREPFHYFRYASAEPLDPNRVLDLLAQVYREIDTVDLLVFPEVALTQDDLDALRRGLVARFGADRMLPLVVAGVRGTRGELETNRVVLSAYFVGEWYEVGQDKHHRWKLDTEQIQTYGLAASLNVRHQWWEAVDIPHRCLSFMVPNGWLNLCPLICEDLARLEPVSDLIRGVGPTLVVAVLMDGPQIADRWPARYVGVLADDPGTSVLSVTSLGMAKRSLPRNREVNLTTVGWKDRRTGWEPIRVPDGGDCAVLLTLNAEWVEEFAADGRSDRGAASLVVFQNARCIT
ncbi:MAG TPA: hypothetical protein VJT67_02885, partial [Longimicrobiaceae bacterium]|nr:hypothetical protein [Longimicrobiaceae bacterium]